MDWLTRMNGALDYIEDHLTDEINMEVLAQRAGSSVFNFQRMFSFITDITLAEYIRRRRLTLAAFELQSSDRRIIDLAFKYGYGTPDSFARAFQNLHGVTPSAARNKNVRLKSYPRLTFHISIKGDEELNYRITNTEFKQVFGKSITIENDENPYEVIPRFWSEFQEDGTYQRICRTAGFEPYSGTSLNAAIYVYKNDESYRQKYMIFTALNPGVVVPDDLEVLSIPALKWVIFSEAYENVEDSTVAIQNLWKRVFSEWFPTSNFVVADGPQLEVYPENSNTVEIWIPVKE